MATHSSILAWKILMDRGTWWATVHRVAKSQTQSKRLSTHTGTENNLTFLSPCVPRATYNRAV